ncbi:MAG TPA: hypothetical protein VK745_26780 [Polyangiaceae bacterium]|nr:hypothetical protein [Polyangiaceae bacterium]
MSRGLNVADTAQQVLRDELLFAFLEPSQRTLLTFDAYSRSSNYVPGGTYFSHGLFPWEGMLLDDSRIPRAGRVLLAAAGGGRELQVLLERGYEVFAFEPVSKPLRSAREIARASSARVVQATYQDLVARARGEHGALDDCQGPFDFCLLGWASLSHLTEPGAVLDVLRALRTLAPAAPVMTSFFTRSAGPPPTGGGARKLRRALRRALQALGGRSVDPGLQFLTGAGFLYSFSRDELFRLSGEAGYEVGFFSELDCPHALLLPKSGARIDSTNGG